METLLRQCEQDERRRLLFLTLCLFLYPFTLLAQTVNLQLAWTPSTSPEIAGYRIYYGTVSGRYDHFVPVGQSTTVNVPALVVGRTYFFAATSLNNLGRESRLSAPIAYTPLFTQAVRPVALTADFSGDGSSDLLWQNERTGEIAVSSATADHVSPAVMIAKKPAGWQIAGIARTTRQSKGDVLWHQPKRGDYQMWYFKQLTFAASPIFRLPSQEDYEVAFYADLNQDGNVEGVFWSPLSGHLLIAMDRGDVHYRSLYTGSITPNLVLVGLADCTGDGKPKLIWRNRLDGTVEAWFLQDFRPQKNVILARPSLQWSLAGFTRIPGALTDSFAWFNAKNRRVSFWLFAKGGQLNIADAGLAANPWEIFGTAKLSARPALLWYTSGNACSSWLLSSEQIETRSYPSGLNAIWRLQPEWKGE